MRSSYDPFGSCASIVDKLLGNAYGIVEFVAKNMTHVRRASFYMKNIYDASQRLVKVVEFTGPDTAGTYIEFNLPSVQIEGEDGSTTARQLLASDIVGWSSSMYDSNDIYRGGDQGLWTVQIQGMGGVVRVTLPGDADTDVLERPMKIMFNYTVPAEA